MRKEELGEARRTLELLDNLVFGFAAHGCLCSVERVGRSIGWRGSRAEGWREAGVGDECGRATRDEEAGGTRKRHQREREG
jgi:hypothetical protein